MQTNHPRPDAALAEYVAAVDLDGVPSCRIIAVCSVAQEALTMQVRCWIEFVSEEELSRTPFVWIVFFLNALVLSGVPSVVSVV